MINPSHVLLALSLLLPAAAITAAQSRVDSARLYVARGASWLEKGEIERAISDYDLALAFDPRSVAAWLNRGVARSRKGDYGGRAHLADGDLEMASIDLERALKLDPKLADAWAHRGIIRAERRDYARAIADFDQALKLNPRLANTWANRGLALMMQGRIEEAEQNIVRYRELGGKGNPAAEELLRELRGRGTG